jgi:hypothetical protein
MTVMITTKLTDQSGRGTIIWLEQERSGAGVVDCVRTARSSHVLALMRFVAPTVADGEESVRPAQL